MNVEQKAWAIVDTAKNSIVEEFNTRDGARDARSYAYRYRETNSGRPNFKRYRLARLTKKIQVEILSK